MSRPTVSVILPVFNGARFLQECVDSILNQTFSDFELICIDDGSTDETMQILASYDDDRIKIITQKNSGIVAALNNGLEIAQGHYIARMDADDICMPNRFSAQVDFLDTHSDVAVVGSFVTVINAQGKSVDKWHIPVTPRWVRKRLWLFPPVYHPTVMVRANVIKSVGGYPDVKHVEDYALWIRLSRTQAMANIPQRLLQYRIHDQNVSSRFGDLQLKNHKTVRRAAWRGRALESTDREFVINSLRSMMAEEKAALGEIPDITRLHQQMADDCICEANLAYGAGRNDVGMARLIELEYLKKSVPWVIAAGLAGVVGFQRTWKLLQWLFPSAIKGVDAMCRW